MFISRREAGTAIDRVWGNIIWAPKKIKHGKQKVSFGRLNKLFGPIIKLFGSEVLNLN